MRLDKGSTELLSAALRHIQDAEHLADSSHRNASPDQAYHLAGFGPECARKACLSIRYLDQAIGHQLGDGAETALDFALAIEPTPSRYVPRGIGTSKPALASWSEQARYRATGTHAVGAALIVREARAVVDAVVFALWTDGCLPVDFEW